MEIIDYKILSESDVKEVEEILEKNKNITLPFLKKITDKNKGLNQNIFDEWTELINFLDGKNVKFMLKKIKGKNKERVVIDYRNNMKARLITDDIIKILSKTK